MVKDFCTTCNGKALVEREREITINIPEGVESGQRLRIASEGEGGIFGGPPGDLYVDILVEQHEIFERDGEHLVIQLPISFSQAARYISRRAASSSVAVSAS